LAQAIGYFLEVVMTTEEELAELKQKINECWALAYPDSIADTGKEKLRVFNLYQDLRDTRWNYRVLSNAYNTMDKERNERRKSTEEAI